MEWIVLLATVFGLVFSGLWLAVALGSAGWIVYFFLANGAQSMIGSAVWNGIQMYSLVAVACFILMGQLILKSGISRKVYPNVAKNI
jgi:C4-dicarboxylate transporter DctM subunit